MLAVVARSSSYCNSGSTFAGGSRLALLALTGFEPNRDHRRSGTTVVWGERLDSIYASSLSTQIGVQRAKPSWHSPVRAAELHSSAAERRRRAPAPVFTCYLRDEVAASVKAG